MIVLAVVITVFVLFAIAICWRPALIIAPALTFFPLEQWAQANSAFFAFHATLMNYGLGCLALLAVVVTIIQGKNPLSPVSAGQVVLWIFYAYVVASCIWSIDLPVSLSLLMQYAPYVITFVFLVPSALQRAEDLRPALATTLVFGTLILSIVLIDTTTHEWGRGIVVKHDVKVVDRAGKERDRLSALIVAEVSGYIIIIATFLNWKGTQRKIWAVLKWLAVLVALATLIRTGTRGELLALAVIPYFFLLARGSTNAASYAKTAAVVAFLIVASILLFPRFATVSASRYHVESLERDYQEGRIALSKQVLEEWARETPLHWFLGLGVNASWAVIGVYCHVIPVEVLAELGLVGMSLYLTLLVICAWAWLRLYKAQKMSEHGRDVAAILGALASYLFVLTWKQNSFLGSVNYVMTIAIICRYSVLVLAEKRNQLRRRAMQYVRYMAHQQPQI